MAVVIASRRPAIRLALGALALYGVLVTGYAVRLGGPYWFLHLGHNSPQSIRLAQRLFGPGVPVPNRDGHDGRAYWVLARDPLLIHGTQDATYLDRPGYRAQRIGYPLVVWPWRLFGERAVVWGLLFTNLAVVAAGTYVAARLAEAVRAPPRAALAFALSPVVTVSVLADFADGLALLWVLAALLAILRRRPGWACFLFAVAALTRETSALAAGAIALLLPDAFPRPRHRLLVGVTPFVVVGTWILYAHWRLGWPHDKLEELDLPLLGYQRAWVVGWSRVHNWGDAALAVVTLILAIAIVVRWWKRRGLLLTAALPFALLVPFLSAQVLDVLLNSTRALGPALTLMVLDAYQPRRPLSVPPPEP